MLRRLLLALPIALAAAGCSLPPGVAGEASDAGPPLLAETARFDAALAAAGPDAERLAADADALTARAEALRTRAAALSEAPVLPPDDRARLDAAGY